MAKPVCCDATELSGPLRMLCFPGGRDSLEDVLDDQIDRRRGQWLRMPGDPTDQRAVVRSIGLCWKAKEGTVAGVVLHQGVA